MYLLFCGTNRFYSQDNLPENIIFLGRLSPYDLNNYYNKTKFYLQLSNFEGFEEFVRNMLCECIPIVSNVNFLPEIIGNSGFILNKRNKTMLVDLIHKLFFRY